MDIEVVKGQLLLPKFALMGEPNDLFVLVMVYAAVYWVAWDIYYCNQ